MNSNHCLNMANGIDNRRRQTPLGVSGVQNDEAPLKQRSVLKSDFGHSRFVGRSLSLLLSIIFILAMFCPFTSMAVERHVVRLGYYERPGFMEGIGDDVRKSGYAYDYLQRISDYTGWKLEYVYAEKDELYSMMNRNEIDLIACMAGGEINPVQMEYSALPIAGENCNIYKLSTDTATKPGFVASFIGKRIGVVKDSADEAYLKQFLTNNIVSCEVVRFNTSAELKDAVYGGKVDVFVAKDTYVSGLPGITVCMNIGYDDLYIGVAPGKLTLLRELNEADAQLRTDDPHFLEQLFTKYFQNDSVSLNQTDKEKAWLQVHDELTIGYLSDYLPFSGTDENKEVTGLLKDYIENLKKQPELEGLSIRAIPYESMQEAYAALQSGEVKVVFPTFRDIWYADLNNLRESTTVFSQTVDLIFNSEYSEAVLDSIAISTNGSVVEGYINQYFPNSKIVMYDTWEDCLDAVKRGEVTSTLMSRYKSSQYLQQPAYRGLRSAGVPKSCALAFAVRSTDVELLALINRGIRLMGTEEIDNSVNRYIYYDFDYSLSGFLAANIEMTIVCAIVFVLMLILVFAKYIGNMKKNERRMQKVQDDLSEAKDQLTDALERADFASQSKTKFLFNMSHDIRTPMNAILGFADLLEKHDDDPEKRRQYTRNIRTAGGYLLDLINEVLEMARIESGKIILNEEQGDYLSMLDAVEIVLSDACERKEHTLTKNVNISHPNLFFDFTKERTIFFNVMSNAIKYTPEGGRIDITVMELPGEDEDNVIIESIISDNGIGMTEDFLPHIFDSFSREKTATESQVIGTGLGMGIVKSYVDLMGGSINVESKLGVGTTITLRIPHRIAHDFVTERTNEEVSFDILKGSKVLLAEDNELNREIACEILREVGIEVRTASDGVECVSILTEEPTGTFDFVLMDIQMPNMDGLKATETIRMLGDPEKACIPIIAMTANVFDTDKSSAYAAGMDGFTGKPIQINELMAELTRVLHKKNR
ncbi:MAG: transporter substrate-binding domain-containing protein [Eubacteriales bacterium]|nr:transporter substrate-binding domain-containing protein [Eubacteriales bacterium]